MVVVVDISGDSCVVVVPLLDGNDSITVHIAERGQELHEDLLGRHLAALDLGVLAGVVYDAEVSRGNSAIAITIKLGEALIDNSLSVGVWRSAEAIEELVVTDNAILVSVKVVQKGLGLAHVDVDSVILKAPVELLLVDFAIAIVVHDAERTAHTTDGPNSAGSQAGFHLLKNLKGKKDTVKTVKLTIFRRHSELTRYWITIVDHLRKLFL